MTCPNPECGIQMDPSWHADVVFPKRETPPIQETPHLEVGAGTARFDGQTFRYFECQRCHQFVVVEL